MSPWQEYIWLLLRIFINVHFDTTSELHEGNDTVQRIPSHRAFISPKAGSPQWLHSGSEPSGGTAVSVGWFPGASVTSAQKPGGYLNRNLSSPSLGGRC